jgi:hypothetical protein
LTVGQLFTNGFEYRFLKIHDFTIFNFNQWRKDSFFVKFLIFIFFFAKFTKNIPDTGENYDFLQFTGTKQPEFGFLQLFENRVAEINFDIF